MILQPVMLMACATIIVLSCAQLFPSGMLLSAAWLRLAVVAFIHIKALTYSTAACTLHASAEEVPCS